jgi:hypothetical protein
MNREPLRMKEVAVAVVFDEPSKKFLLVLNQRWNGYAFPMKHIEPEGDPAAAALAAVQGPDFPLRWPHARATPLARLGKVHFSVGVHETTGYSYQVFEIDPGAPLDVSDKNTDLRYATYDELIASPVVTYPTQAIARDLVEERRVAEALIKRPSPEGTQYLLIAHSNGLSFFPATRMKSEMYPAQGILEAVRGDLGYDGPITIGDPRIFDKLQPSQRFIPGERHFHFYVCDVDFPGIDLTAADNPLERGLKAVEAALRQNGTLPADKPYWRWCTATDMGNGGDWLSPSIWPLYPDMQE